MQTNFAIAEQISAHDELIPPYSHFSKAQLFAGVMHTAWYGHVMRKDESDITKRVMSMNVDGHPRRGRPKKRWMDCVKDDMRIKGGSMMTSDRREWKKKTCCADPT
jgi:hypothetical protein